MVGGGFPGRKCVGVKNEIVVGRHPVGAWWKPWIIIWMFWVMEVWVFFSQAFAEKQSVAEKSSCAPFHWWENCPVFPPKRADPYSLELDWTSFAYTETSVMPRKVSFEERKVLWQGPLGLMCWGKLGAAMPGSERFSAPRVMLRLPKRACGGSQNWSQSPVAPSAVGRRREVPTASCSPLPAFSPWVVKGPWSDQAPNLGTLVDQPEVRKDEPGTWRADYIHGSNLRSSPPSSPAPMNTKDPKVFWHGLSLEYLGTPNVCQSCWQFSIMLQSQCTGVSETLRMLWWALR